MLSKNKGKLILTSIIILLPILAGLILWKKLPDQMPVHWNSAGEIDGWSHKWFVVFALPFFMLAIHWICVVITCLDPKNKSITNKMFDFVLWIIPVMSILVCFLSYVAGMGIKVSVDIIVPVFIGLMFVVIGSYIPKCQPNYTIGIKVPWTLHNENNWNATHRFAGPVWVIGGIVLIATGFFGLNMIYFIILMAIGVIPVVYSYLYYRKNCVE